MKIKKIITTKYLILIAIIVHVKGDFLKELVANQQTFKKSISLSLERKIP